MTDLDAAATAQPETVAGIILQDDKALILRTPSLDLPALNGHTTSWQLIPHAATLARIVASTEFVPAKLRNRPAAVAALMLLGHELGIGPMAAMQSMTVTDDGDIITYAKTLRAIVRSHGHRLWPERDVYTSQRVAWSGYRIDDQEHPMTVTYTLEDAKIAGLLRPSRSGRPTAWEKSPRSMLSARASAELCRLLDEDGLLGISRVVEEGDEEDAADIAPPSAPSHPDEPDPSAPEGPKTRTRSTRPRTTPHTAAGAPPQPDAPKVELEVPGDQPETQTSTQAPAAGTPPDSPSPVADLEVPGDEDRIQITDAGVAAAGTQPTLGEVVDELNNATPAEHMPNDQKIAMLCREAGIDRARLVAIMTDKRSESSKDLTQSQSAFVIEHVRAVLRGEERFNASTIPPFVVIPDAELVEVARVELSRLAGSDRLRPTLAAVGWDEERDGKVTPWLSTLDRPKLLEAIAAARAAQRPPEATE